MSISWTDEKRKLSDLKPASYNPRKWSPLQKGKLMESISRFNLADPLIINRNNTIIGGHFRFETLKEKGVEIVDVRVPDRDLTAEEEKELNIRLNKNNGEFDFKLLAGFEEGFLDNIGFDSKELDKIFHVDPILGEDDVPEIKEAGSIKHGDIFQLGAHRLMCGDSSNDEDVKKLMDGKRAQIVFTDPPYGIDYGAKNRFLNSFQEAGRNLNNIANDNIGKDELCPILLKAFSLAREYGTDDCSYYVTAPQGGDLGLMMMMMMKESGLPVKHVLIWNKNSQNFSLGRLDYEYKHEPILFTWKDKHTFYGQGQFKNSVWDIPKERSCKEHPTMKPIALIENALLNSSPRAGLCLDLFLGSGSTLIACEKNNRFCFGMEIEPHYCDVIINRWEKFSGKKAVKCEHMAQV